MQSFVKLCSILKSFRSYDLPCFKESINNKFVNRLFCLLLIDSFSVLTIRNGRHCKTNRNVSENKNYQIRHLQTKALTIQKIKLLMIKKQQTCFSDLRINYE